MDLSSNNPVESTIEDIMASLPKKDREPTTLEPKQPTAVLFVGGYGGLGIHALLSIQRLFPGHFKNFVFVTVGLVDSAQFKGVVDLLKTAKHGRGSRVYLIDFRYL